MKKLNLLKILILVTFVLLGTEKAFCEATVAQQSRTVVQPTVAVEKVSANEGGSINPANGAASDLSSLFALKSNDEGTFFVVYSTIDTADEGQVSAFDGNWNLLFANKDYPPTLAAVNNAKAGIAGNMNVIAYKMNLDGDSFDIVYIEESMYGDCYKVSLKESLTTGNLEHTVGGDPVLNTYGQGEDMVGNYTVTLYVTATTKL